MCGIAGFLDSSGRQSGDALASTVSAMAETLAHRGPDGHGAWVDPDAGVALGHRRLAILDLSPEGHQPMSSPGGRYVLSYNGEVYNFKELRRQLAAEGHRFRSGSDTEVLVAGIERWGLETALERLNGMFAFALWDRRERTLSLVRDRLGEKPLYYGWMGRAFVFASELKALRAHPAFVDEIDRGALALYFRHNCVPAPHSVYRHVRKLLPGTLLTVPAGATSLADLATEAYWSARDAAAAGTRQPFDAAPEELEDELDHLLRDAVRLRMRADVPLGAFLSGGIDSSVVVALMQAQSTERVRTFTIGFEDPAYDESADAAKVASHLGTDHLDLRVTPEEAMAVVPRLPVLYDEPFADSSQIPTFLVSEMARREVTVSLSGDGGDELFAGYNRYEWCGPIWDRARRVPAGLRRVGAAVLLGIPSERWDQLFRLAGPALPSRLRVRTPGYKIQKLCSVLGAAGLEEMYLGLASHWKHPDKLVRDAVESPSALTDPRRHPDLSDPVERMMYFDLVTYLPDDILAKLDRASMSVSLECRVPLLDHRVVEFAWRLPLSLKLRDGRGKWLLRRVLHRYVPPELLKRPKMGFGLPIGQWLRGPLRAWSEELLDERRLRRDGLLDPTPVRALWQRHLAGHEHQDQLWDVLMFQAWREETAGRVPTAAPARRSS